MRLDRKADQAVSQGRADDLIVITLTHELRRRARQSRQNPPAGDLVRDEPTAGRTYVQKLCSAAGLIRRRVPLIPSMRSPSRCAHVTPVSELGEPSPDEARRAGNVEGLDKAAAPVRLGQLVSPRGVARPDSEGEVLPGVAAVIGHVVDHDARRLFVLGTWLQQGDP